MSPAGSEPDGVEATERLVARASDVLRPWGVSHGALRYPGGVFPQFAVAADGCRLVDAAGRSYVDWIMGWGPAILGYRHPAVERAIAAQLRAGPQLSLMHPCEIDVAEQLVAMIPCAEQVAFGKNGSDVLTAAVRIARAATRREVVLVCGYHGFHDWYMASVPDSHGIPRCLDGLVHHFEYDDAAGLAAALERHSEHVAAVVIDPAPQATPTDGFLARVRELSRDHGCLLIFDEMLTGFRLARGGAGEAFGVAPDLACFGKGIANGMPLSALVGPRRYMRGVDHVGYGMTYRGETLSLAAARACLQVQVERDVPGHLARVGEELRAGFREACSAAGLAADLAGPPARMGFRFPPGAERSTRDILTLFLQECLKHGVLSNGDVLPSLAHDDTAIEVSVAAFRRALDVVAPLVDA